MGIEILPPDINTSLPFFTVEEGGIRFGLTAIKGVGLAAVEPLLAVREAGGDFSVALAVSAVAAREVRQPEGPRVPGQGRVFRPLRSAAKGRPRQPRTAGGDDHSRARAARARPGLPLRRPAVGESRGGDPDRPRGRNRPIGLAWEREVLGFYLSGHPLDAFRHSSSAMPTAPSTSLPSGSREGAETRHGRWSGVGAQDHPHQEGGPEPGPSDGRLPARRCERSGPGGRLSRHLRVARALDRGRRGAPGGRRPSRATATTSN